MRGPLSMLIASTLLLALNHTGAAAQGELGVSPIMQRLDLTVEQVTLVEPVVRDTLQRHSAIKRGVTDGRVTGATLDDDLTRERQRANADLRGVFNDAQRAEWERIQNEMAADVRSAARVP